MALSAWLWVEVDTWRSVASMVRKASTPLASISLGCRMAPALPDQRTKKRTQYTYTFSVARP